MNVIADSETTQSDEVETVKYYYCWHIIKSSGKRKAKRGFTLSVKHQKGQKRKLLFKALQG